MELKIENNKTDNYLEDGELTLDQATKLIFSYNKKEFSSDNYVVRHVYTMDL